jgi:hypothetical protein
MDLLAATSSGIPRSRARTTQVPLACPALDGRSRLAHQASWHENP